MQNRFVTLEYFLSIFDPSLSSNCPKPVENNPLPKVCKMIHILIYFNFSKNYHKLYQPKVGKTKSVKLKFLLKQSQ